MANRYGADFSGYERTSYSRLVLKDLSFAQKGTRFKAARVEFYQPITWLWLHQTKTAALANHLQISDWELEFTSKEKKEERKTSAVSVFEKIEETVPKLKEWLPSATLSNGLVRVGTNDLHISAATWNGDVLKGDVSAEKFGRDSSLTLDTSKRGTLDVQVTVPSLEAKTTLQIAKRAERLEVTGDIFWQTNQATVLFGFDRDALIPDKGRIVADSLQVPAERVRLTNYHNLNTRFTADWNGTNFLVDLHATAQPKKSNLSPMEATIRATGNTNAVRFETFSVTLPWAKADLSRNVEVSFKGRLLSETAEFNINIDLSKQEFVPSKGTVTGNLFLKRNETIYPDATFKVSVDEFAFKKYKADHVETDGAFEWPQLRINHFFISAEPDTVLKGELLFDLQNREIKTGTLLASGSIPSGILSSNIVAKKLNLTAKFQGPIEKITHEGRIEMGRLVVPHLQPINLTTEWQADELEFSRFTMTLQTTNASVRLTGSGSIATNGGTIQFSEVNFATNGADALVLQQPFTFSLQKNEKALWDLVTTSVELKGSAGHIAVAGEANWPTRGKATISVEKLNSQLLRPFFKDSLPVAGIDFLHLIGGWTNGPAIFSLKGNGYFHPPQDLPLTIGMAAVLNEKDLRLGELSIESRSNSILTVQGYLPLRIDPAADKKFALSADDPIDFRASTKADSPFWAEIAKLLKLKLKQPELRMAISGTLNKPAANISASAEKIEWTGASRPIPTASDLQIELQADRKNLRLEKLNFRVEDQPILIQASMPIGEMAQGWKSAFDWRKASGRVMMEQAQVGPFIKFLPQVLGPSGSIDLNVTFSPGPRVNGDLFLHDIETRALGTIGTLHDVGAHLKFTESILQFTNVTGVLGGELLGLSGFINFTKKGPNNLPLFDLNLAGQNVPLTRKPDLILRADFELNALNTLTNEQPVVSGLVHFNESFFLGDLKMLLPGKVTKPKERPPFFSVDAEPFAKWKLNVRLEGENFLRVRTPLFRGGISANWRLRGTLQEPLALGDAKIESGQVQFPFSNLKVQQGFISLTSEDPYRPHIFATASSKTFGYDVQMALNGPADKPIIEFSSTPPLNSEQIVLMLTAGELPKREASFTAQQRAGKLAMFLGKSILSKFTSDDGGAERLTITSGENITEQGKETYALEYKITEHVSLVGEYDRFGALNAGVKWRVYSK